MKASEYIEVDEVLALWGKKRDQIITTIYNTDMHEFERKDLFKMIMHLVQLSIKYESLKFTNYIKEKYKGEDLFLL